MTLCPRARTRNGTWSWSLPAESAGPLLAILDEARRLGFLGPGPVADHIDHSRAFLQAWALVAEVAPSLAVDLGTGGGIPGLVLALAWPSSSVLLLDGSARRSAFVTEAVEGLGLVDRVVVLHTRAEAVPPRWRQTADLVVARGFAPPAVTAECAAPLLVTGGWLAVAEPPILREDRWPPAGLELLGLQAGPRLEAPAHIQLLQAATPCPARYPRRTGIPGKRPLWRTE